MAGISEADLKAIFEEFDSDNSGVIDAKELVNALKRVFGDERSDEEIKELAGVSTTALTNTVIFHYR